MGKLEQLSEQLAEAQKAARAWKRRALGAEARVTALEAEAIDQVRYIESLRGDLHQIRTAQPATPAPVIRTRCTNVSTANSGRVQCSRSSGHTGPHHDAWGALFWVNHYDA